MRKSAFCICENKGVDQLRGNHAADQCLCFHYIVKSIYLLNPNFKPPAILCGCTAWVVLDLVGNPEDRFSCDAAQMITNLLNRLKRANGHRNVALPIFHIRKCWILGS